MLITLATPTTSQAPLFDVGGNIWRIVKDGYQPAAALYMRHYSYHPYKDNRRAQHGYRNRFLIVGPGEKMVLMTPHNDALFVWRKFQDDSGQQGVNCAVFRNESTLLSSWLIEQACELAWQRWSGERLYTYVDPASILSNNAGYCYKCAGWQLVRNEKGKPQRTKVKGLFILEITP